MGLRLPVSVDSFEETPVTPIDVSEERDIREPTIVHYKTPGGEFLISVSPSDFLYLPRLMDKLQEFLNGCGYDYVKLRRAGDDYENWTWEDTRKN